MVKADLVQEAKDYINFTWDDPKKSQQIERFVDFAMHDLNAVAGVAIDFDADLHARQLLKDAVLYLDSHAYNEFKTNYNGDLNELRMFYETKNQTQSI